MHYIKNIDNFQSFCTDKTDLWHYDRSLNKRAARLRLAVQAPAITTTEQGGTQSARERALAAEPPDGPHAFPRATVFEMQCLHQL